MTEYGPLTTEVYTSIKAAKVDTRDRAAAQLALRYAQLLDAQRGHPDEFELYNDLGPKLLAALKELGLTVAGRGLKGGETGGVVPGSKFDELRARRERGARQH